MFTKTGHSHRDLPTIIFLVLPFIIYLYPAVALLMATSNTPTFFNTYSANLLLLNVITELIYGAFLIGILTGWRILLFCAVFCLSALPLIPSTSSVLNLPAFAPPTLF